MTASRVAVVTGGLSGIGLATVKALAKAGHKVAIGSRRGSDSDFAATQIAELDDDILALALDVADQSSVDAFFKQVTQKFGPVEILVNCAGIYREAVISGHSDKDWDDQMNINLTGPFRTIRSVMPGMIKGKWGRIVNIASTAGHIGAVGYSGYCASKAGLIGLSKVVSQEGAPHNVNCVSISPTWVETPMLEAAAVRHAGATGTTIKTARAEIEHSNPQQRLVQPEEIAALAAFCCSEDCPALTNEDILVNAGAVW